MPNFSGLWTSRQQLQAVGAGIWPATPGAPTIGTATAGNATASVTFTAPAYTGYPAGITGYTVTSSPGGVTATGSSSPITVSGLTNGTAYTFTVRATNATGTGPASAASNSVTPSPPQQIEYTTAGTYTFVAPAGLSPSTVSVVCIGGGGSGNSNQGGSLSYKNNIPVTSGSSYTVVVGGGGNTSAGGSNGGTSYFVNTGVCLAAGGNTFDGRVGDGGGNGGDAGSYSGGGAGGYAGNGAAGVSSFANGNNAPSGGGGGSGGGVAGGGVTTGGGGGGTGILGQGSSGTGGLTEGTPGSGTFWRGLQGNAGSGGLNTDNLFAFINSGAGLSGRGVGGEYGGASGRNSSAAPEYRSAGGTGAVRIIWSTNGVTRTFPSTNTGNL